MEKIWVLCKRVTLISSLFTLFRIILLTISALTELTRVFKPGGVIYLDHVPIDQFWSDNPLYEEFQAIALRIDWGKYLFFQVMFERSAGCSIRNIRMKAISTFGQMIILNGSASKTL